MSRILRAMWCIATGACLANLGLSDTAHAQATFLGLGDLPGGSFFSQATGVSADGSVVVGNAISASGSEAFRWTAPGEMVGLGDLPGGTFSSIAHAVSADGSTVVGQSQSASGPEAFRWTASTGMVGLGDLPGGAFSSGAGGVSADGSVVAGRGRTQNFAGFERSEAFRWTASTGMVGLGVLSGFPPDTDSEAYDISADASVIVGISWLNTGGEEAFRWTAQDGMVGLGQIPGATGRWSDAFGISPDGSVVVGQVGQTSTFFVPQPARWTA
jgi:probable HAF family extracellular repeat protein